MENPARSNVYVNFEYPFTEGLKSPAWVSILIEKQVGQSFKMLKKIEDRQIKDLCQLTDLVKRCWFYNQEIWWLWERSTWKVCNNCESSKIFKRCYYESWRSWENKIYTQEQYSSRNGVLFQGLKEEKSIKTDDWVLELLSEELSEDVFLVELDRTYRIIQKADWNSKLRPVIINFARYNIRKKVFKSKKTEEKEY